MSGYSLGMRQRLGARGGAPRRPARCSSSTSRRTASTRRASAGCATSCARSPARGARSCVSSHVLAEIAQTVDRRRDHPPRPARQAGADRRGARGRAAAASRVAARTRAGCASSSRAAGRRRRRRSTATARGRARRPSASARSPRRTAIVLHELTVERATLEEAFLELTGGETTRVTRSVRSELAEAADDARAVLGVSGRARAARRDRGRRATIGSAPRTSRPERRRLPARPVETAGFAVLLAILLGITARDQRVPARHDDADVPRRAAPRARARGEGDRRRPCSRLGFALPRRSSSSRSIGSAVARDRDAESHVVDGGASCERTAARCSSARALGAAGRRDRRARASQVAALVGTLVWIFLGETLLLGLFGAARRRRRRRLPARPARSTRPTASGGDDLLSLRRRVAVALGLDRVARRGRIGAHAPPRHHLSATLGRWPRRSQGTRSSSSTSTRSPTAATASRA